MKTFYDNELEETLKFYFENKAIIKCDSTIHFEFIENNFPIFMNRIDWKIIQNKEYFNLHDVTIVEQRNSTIKLFLSKLEEACNSIINEDVVIIGDSLIDTAYCMPYSVFKQNVLVFFSLPQHTFVLFEKLGKCINYTFERDLYFG
jgi:hypothetical protein